MLYNGDKDVNAAARSPEGGPAKAGDLSASSLLGMDCLSMLQLTHLKMAQPKPKELSASSLPKHNRSKSGEMKVREGQTRAKARALLVFAGHRPT